MSPHGEKKAKTPEQYKNSYRLSFNPRKEVAGSPLIVLHCEGVLGEFVENSFWDEKVINPFYTRKGIKRGLAQIKKKFQVILASNLIQKDLKKVIAFFAKKGCFFDGVYCSTPGSNKFSYCQIAKDFELETSVAQINKMLVSNIMV